VVGRVVALDEIADVDGFPPRSGGETRPGVGGGAVGLDAFVGRGDGHPCHLSRPAGGGGRRSSDGTRGGNTARVTHPPLFVTGWPVVSRLRGCAVGGAGRTKALSRSRRSTLR